MDNSWIKDAIGYIIYPSTYYDANNDGIGDLKGITEKIPYLHDLGINLIWICPILASPMDDNGYDVSDYYQINKLFGNMQDLDDLIHIAHENGIRIIMDFVLNHTSDENKWFIEAKENPNSKKRDYYFFKEGKIDKNGERIPPNNWKGFFSTPAWEYDETSGLYYFHIFSPKMPDVDWRNKDVQDEYVNIAKFYLDKGIDGFRLDACAHLAKDYSFSDSTLPVDETGTTLDTDKFSNRKELFDYLKIMKDRVFSKYDCVTIGEVGGGITPSSSLKFDNLINGPIDMVFNFDASWSNGAYGSIDKKDDEIITDVLLLKNSFKLWYDTCYGKVMSLPIYWDNHDHPRVLSQYGSVKYRKESAKALITTLLFMYGTPFIYYGDEIGMSNVNYTELSSFTDVGDQNYIKEIRDSYTDKEIIRFLNRTSRINARTPMQWSGQNNAGFTNAKPIVPANENYLSVNVEDELKDKDSILNYYKLAIRTRKIPEILSLVLDEKFDLVDSKNPDVFAYKHGANNDLVVIANFRASNVKFNFDLSKYEVLLHNYDKKTDRIVSLAPFETYLLRKYQK